MNLLTNEFLGIKVQDPMAVAGIDSSARMQLEELEKTMKLKETLKPLVIYHANCADGFSAAWVFWKVQDIIEQSFDFFPGVYNNPPPDVSDRDVFLVDFSYKRKVIKDMIELGGARSITVIDHHVSAMQDLRDLDSYFEEEAKIAQMELNGTSLEEWENPLTLIFDMNRSGATMAWDYWKNYFEKAGMQRPLLLGHIEDRDLWRFKLPMTREIQAAVFSYEYSFENWDKLMSMDSVELLKLGVAGEAIERKHHKDIKELVTVCKRQMEIAGYIVPVASLPYIFSSDAAHLMAKEWINGELFAACYWDTSTHRVFSLRSTTNGMDVSVIATKFGGGGHKNAAGFSVPRDHPLAML